MKKYVAILLGLQGSALVTLSFFAPSSSQVGTHGLLLSILGLLFIIWEAVES